MSDIHENRENPNTPEEITKGTGGTTSGELTREQMQAKMKQMSRKITSLKKKSARSKRAKIVTPTKLNFDGEGSRKEGDNPEREADPGENDEERSQLPV